MIITKLQGGLGNQMFQWAYGKALSIIHGTELLLDTDYYNYQYNNTHRNFELNKFPNLINDNSFPNNKPIIEITDNFIYKEFLYDKNNNYYLNGYWQSEKYFSGISELIKQNFKPDDKTLEKLKKIIKKNSVSLHIRRTDYLTSNGFHPIQMLDYYNEALEMIGNYDHILIFSDDITWCKENLKYKNMIFIDGQDNIDDLWLMSLCKHNIIANSSFSWWGAWLNNNNDKIVISPKKWFGDNSNLNYSDIIPNNWIKI